MVIENLIFFSTVGVLGLGGLYLLRLTVLLQWIQSLHDCVAKDPLPDPLWDEVVELVEHSFHDLRFWSFTQLVYAAKDRLKARLRSRTYGS